MALPASAQRAMYDSVVALSAQFERLGLAIVDQYECGNLDGRTASTTHDLLLETAANLMELKAAIESGFAPGPESRELDGAVATATERRDQKDRQDLARLYDEAPVTAEPERLPPIRDDELPGWDYVTHDVPNN